MSACLCWDLTSISPASSGDPDLSTSKGNKSVSVAASWGQQCSDSRPRTLYALRIWRTPKGFCFHG